MDVNTVSNFPSSVTPTNCLIDLLDFKVGTIDYEDGGTDYNIDQLTPKYRITLEFDFLSIADTIILDAHFTEAAGAVSEFSFIDPYTSTEYEGCHYSLENGLEAAPHVKYFSPKRKVILIQENELR